MSERIYRKCPVKSCASVFYISSSYDRHVATKHNKPIKFNKDHPFERQPIWIAEESSEKKHHDHDLDHVNCVCPVPSCGVQFTHLSSCFKHLLQTHRFSKSLTLSLMADGDEEAECLGIHFLLQDDGGEEEEGEEESKDDEGRQWTEFLVPQVVLEEEEAGLKKKGKLENQIVPQTSWLGKVAVRGLGSQANFLRPFFTDNCQGELTSKEVQAMVAGKKAANPQFCEAWEILVEEKLGSERKALEAVRQSIRSVARQHLRPKHSKK